MTFVSKEAILPVSILIEGPEKPEDVESTIGLPGSIKASFNARSIGVDALILTQDQFLLIGQRRTFRVGKVGGLHIVGGFMETTEHVTATLAREIEEEVGLKKDEWSVVNLLGVTQSKETLAVDVIYFCKTGLYRSDIATRKTDGELGIKFISNTPDATKRILLNFLRTASTPSTAALYLYGKQNFGLEWADAILDRIARRNTVYGLFNDQQKEAHMHKLANRLSRI